MYTDKLQLVNENYESYSTPLYLGWSSTTFMLQSHSLSNSFTLFVFTQLYKAKQPIFEVLYR